MQFNAKRSQERIDIAFPCRLNAISPFFTTSPSFKFLDIFNFESKFLKINSANLIPAIIPLSFINKFALLYLILLILAKDVWSPLPKSSFSAFFINSFISLICIYWFKYFFGLCN